VRRKQADIATDPEAFEAFYRRHVDAITSFLARRVDDPNTVADLVAEVFLAVLDSAHTYRPGLGNEIAWLYGVARNTLSAERRRAFKETRLADRVRGRRPLDSDDVAELEERIDAESVARRAFQAMAGLPDGDRAMLELVVIDQLTISEAATALGIRQGAARGGGSRGGAVPEWVRPAYVVTKNTDGTITLKINEFRDPDQVESDLAKLGVTADVSYVKPGTRCAPDRGQRKAPREALLVAAAERIVELHHADMDQAAQQHKAAAAPPASATELVVDLLTESLLVAATTLRTRYLAIFELQLEAARRPALASALAGLQDSSTQFTAGHHAELGLPIPRERVPGLLALYGGALFTLVTAPPESISKDVVQGVAHAIARGALDP
jgi:RNA polymerase sigma factor (sigma-70 family)